ncbi:unnamed protein product [Callosobruchus maculatus]|uniref:Uncharacterized protein n=1 Tax=Callosobruchus maculatus TaxID=64391 RepID=A0A653CYH3_CALMS|nr:unnamed protein product [Callosobruchus maculatus]
MKSHIPPPAVAGTGIPKPTAAIKGTTKISREVSTTSFKPPPSTGISRESSQVSLKQHKPAIAMVSPIKNESNMSESTNSSSTTGPSSDSSMICKASSESSSEYQSSSPSKKLLDLNEEPQSPKEVEKEEQHCDKEKEDNISKESDRREENLGHIKEEEREDSPGMNMCISIEPMRPLLRGYCSTLTLPSRQRHYHHKIPPDCASDYCEVSIANGYLSDGEILRNTAMMDIGDGYMSEGGSVLYTRRLQTMPAHLTNGSPHRLTGGCSGLGGTCAGNGLGVLTEQAVAAAAAAAAAGAGSASGGRRQGGGGGPSRESPPPPPAPRATSKSRNGAPSPPAVIVHHQQQPPPAPAPGSPPAGRRKGSPHSHSGSKEKGGGGNKGARGVPQSFGYVKRNGNGGHQTVVVNGAANGQAIMQVVQNPATGKTQAVSVVPRTKVKVSGGTQTCSSDLQQSHKASPPAFKSYSLTGNTANQLSQSVRERLMMGSQSLPKGAVGVVHHVDYGPVMRTARPKASDGSLSDTQAIESVGNPYAPWLRHSNTYSVAPRLSETDSMESLTSLPSHRSSLIHTRLLRDSPSRLSRSNSIRSTKSEKLYPSMLHRNNSAGGGGPNSGGGCDPSDAEPYYCIPSGGTPLSHWSQPTSPAPAAAGRTFPLSPTHPGAPLVSTASSLYSSAEEKQAHEIRKLRRELQEAQEKVHTLTSQLSTNKAAEK